MAKDLIGKTIAGRYRILEEIGRGGLTTVYKALDTRFNRVVALKVLHSHFARDVEFERRFQHEANVLARLRHPNIVQMYEYGRADGLAYLVVEYVEGSLADVLAEGKPLDVDYAIEIVRQVGEALSYAHRQGIIHRDIKPSNILVSKDGRVLLSDLGLAIAASKPTITEIGTILGTVDYMSPEQAMGKPVDARSDIYSLGSVLYELLTGRLPFSGESPWQLLHQIIYEPPLPPRRLNPVVPPAVEHVVLRALAKDPDQRYQTVDELVAALVEVSEAPAPTVCASRAPAPAPRASYLPLLGAFGGLLLLALLALTLRFGPALWNWARNQPILAASVASGVLLVLSLGLIARLRHRALFCPPPSGVPPAPSPSPPATEETIPYTPAPAPSTALLRTEPSAMAWLLVLNGPHRGQQLRLADSVSIGRAAHCDIILDDGTVSREHAKIRLENGRFYIYDLGSFNGTFVNGIRVMKQALRDRDEIRLGNTIMLFVQAVSPEDLTAEAKRRLREFDLIWDQLTRSVRYD